MMYQLIPYVEQLSRLQERFAGSSLARFTGGPGRADRATRGLGFAAVALVARPSGRERAELERVPTNVARLLSGPGGARVPLRGRPPLRCARL